MKCEKCKKEMSPTPRHQKPICNICWTNITEETLLDSETVKRWKDTIHTETTWNNYVYRFLIYLNATRMTPDELILEKAKALQATDVTKRGAADDRLIAWHKTKEEDAPGMAQTIFKTVRSFFKANYVPLSARIPSYVKQREYEHIPTKTECQQMVNLADLETATFFIVCAESGRRDGTIADLQGKHILKQLQSWDKESGDPFIFQIPQKRNPKGKIIKSKRIFGRWGFLCADAVERIQLLIKTKFPNGLKLDDKLFPMETTTYSKKIGELGMEIGINPKEGNGLKPFRTHNLRKRAQTIMEGTGIPLNWVDRILGHKPRGSQADVYSMPPKEKLAEMYKLAMRELTLFGMEVSKKDTEEFIKNLSGDMLKKVLVEALSRNLLGQPKEIVEPAIEGLIKEFWDEQEQKKKENA